jgi:hypothetical protein
VILKLVDTICFKTIQLYNSIEGLGGQTVLRHIFAKIEIQPLIDSLAALQGPVQVDWNLTKKWLSSAMKCVIDFCVSLAVLWARQS